MAAAIQSAPFDVSVEEDRGRVISIRESWLVTGLTGSTSSTYYGVLALFNTALKTIHSAHPSNANLLLTSRSVRMHSPNNPDKAIVDLEYSHIVDAGVGFIWTGSASLGQITTNTDRFGNGLLVAHTYADDDDDWPGETKYQLGEADVVMPRQTLVGTGRIYNQNPFLWAYNVVGRTNAYDWLDYNYNTLLCTSCSVDVIDLSSYTYDPVTGWDGDEFEVTVELQFKQETWWNVVSYTDPRTGLTPPIEDTTVVDERFLDLLWYPEIDYALWFG